MKISGEEMRFASVQDPPFPYGVGLDDPNNEYWLILPYQGKPSRIFYRSKLSVGDMHNGWQEIGSEKKFSVPKIHENYESWITALHGLAAHLNELEIDGLSWHTAQVRVCEYPVLERGDI